MTRPTSEKHTNGRNERGRTADVAGVNGVGLCRALSAEHVAAGNESKWLVDVEHADDALWDGAGGRGGLFGLELWR